jgi:hypothetical protein
MRAVYAFLVLTALVFAACGWAALTLAAAREDPLDEPLVVTKRMWCGQICRAFSDENVEFALGDRRKTVLAKWVGDPALNSSGFPGQCRKHALRASKRLEEALRPYIPDVEVSFERWNPLPGY